MSDELESKQYASENEIFDKVSRVADKNHKLSWRRKRDKMVKLIAELQPLEDEMLAISMKKQPIMDKVHELREEMIKDCIHPKDQLVLWEGRVQCKFCGCYLTINE